MIWLVALLLLLTRVAEGADVRPQAGGGVATSVVGPATGTIFDQGGMVYTVGPSNYLTCDGVTDDTAALVAVFAFETANQTVTFEPGSYTCVFASQITLLNRIGLRVTGPGGGRNHNDTVGPILKFTGTGAGSFIHADGVTGLEIDHLNLVYSSASFTGNLIDLTQISGTGQSVWINIHDNKITSLGSIKTAGSLIKAAATIDASIERNTLCGAVNGILGGAIGNIIRVRDNFFDTNCFSGNGIKAGGQNWVVAGNVTEPTTSATAAAFFDVTSDGLTGLKYHGNWHGDADSGAWWQATSPGFVRGASITGNLFQAGTGTVVLLDLRNTSGTAVNGNWFNTDAAAAAILVDSTTLNITVGFNHTASGIALSGVVGGRSFIDTGIAFHLRTPSTPTPFILSGSSVGAFIQFRDTDGVTGRGSFGWNAGQSAFDILNAAGSVSLLRVTTAGNVSWSGTTATFQNAGVTGTLAWSPSGSNQTIVLPNGSTDFTGTGCTSCVLQQSSVGAAITVGQLAASNLSNGTTGSGGSIVLATGPTIANPIITGSVGLGIAVPLATLHLSGATAPTFSLSDTGLAHGITTIIPDTTAFFVLRQNTDNEGGMQMYGLSSAAGRVPIQVWGAFGNTDPTDTIPAIWFIGVKKTGTTFTSLAATETVFQVATGTSPTNLFSVLGNGNTTTGGTATVAAATCTVSVTAITIKNGLVTSVAGTGC